MVRGGISEYREKVWSKSVKISIPSPSVGRRHDDKILVCFDIKVLFPRSTTISGTIVEEETENIRTEDPQ